MLAKLSHGVPEVMTYPKAMHFEQFRISMMIDSCSRLNSEQGEMQSGGLERLRSLRLRQGVFQLYLYAKSRRHCTWNKRFA